MKTRIVDGKVYNFYIDVPDEKENDMIKYAAMSKRFMNKPFNSVLDIVGNMGWNQAFPYEDLMFYDKDHNPLVDFSNSIACDFACGPGRMIDRAGKLFKRVDGIDISEYALEYDRQTYPNSNFYVSSGIDVGDAPVNTYDLVFSTIALQHIPSRTIRTNIFKGLHSILKPGGTITYQIAFNPNGRPGVWSHDAEHAAYDADFFGAQATNGHADVVINNDDLPMFQKDMEDIFEDVSFGMLNVEVLYGNLGGHTHPPYWASHWIFVKGKKAL
jgi:SAM-dependent methyltransferase